MIRSTDDGTAELRAALGAIERTAPRPVGLEAGRLTPSSTQRPRNPVMVIAVALAAVVALALPMLLMGDNATDRSPATGAPDGGSSIGPGRSDQRAVATLEESDLLSPLTLFLRGGHETMSGLYAAREGIVATCMAGKGWTYHPVDYAIESSIESPLTLGGALEWRRQYGFGDTMYPELGEADRARFLEAVEVNRDYAAGLSDEERRRYGEDLDGGEVSETGGGAVGSCRGIAAASTAPLEDAAITAFWRPLLMEAIDDHPDLGDLRDAWRTCMVTRGFNDVPEPHELHAYYSSHLRQLSDREERLEWEIGIAVADLECAASTYLPAEVDIQYQIIEQIAVEFPEHSDLARAVLRHRTPLEGSDTQSTVPPDFAGEVLYLGLDREGWVFTLAGEASDRCAAIRTQTSWVKIDVDGTTLMHLNLSTAALDPACGPVPTRAADLGPRASPPGVVDLGEAVVLGQPARVIQEGGAIRILWLWSSGAGKAEMTLIPGTDAPTVPEAMSIIESVVELSSAEWEALLATRR